MLLPRYSLRTTLLATSGCAALFCVFGFALRGHSWAIVPSTAIAVFMFVLLVHACQYVVIEFLTKYIGDWQVRTKTRQGGYQTQLGEVAPPTTSNESAESTND